VSVRLSHICLFAKFANFHPTQKIVNKQQQKTYRPALQDMCGTREILNAGNLLEHVTRLRTISMNFSNIHRVGQVSVSKLHKKKAVNPK